MPIRLLSPDTIGKIAAGEVVERPVSVVKELIENAIDAGATRIDVEIAAGGSESIRVSDNGSGIARDDLAVALQRHATSKLTRFADLDSLRTLGFRGEALASIAAVSVFEIRTRSASESAGSLLRTSFGDAPVVTAGASPVGTTVTVQDLFGNVPARRRFLRQAGTEATYITRLIGAYACHRSDVAWSMTVDGRRSLATSGEGDAVQAAIGVFGAELADEALSLGPVSEAAVVPGVDVTGWITSPRVSRSHRQNLYLFVNGRLIQHRGMTYALEEAYHSLLLVGRHPMGMVRIEVPPTEVDVNVHPTKAEVRFSDERAAARAVQRAAHEALLAQRQDVLPQVTFERLPGPPSVTQTFFGGQRQEWDAPREAGERHDDPGTQDQPMPHEAPTLAHRSGLPVLRVLGQVAASYIIAEGPGGMFMIDQHAAHERVMYERILDQMETRSVTKQPLLDPLVIELAPHELAIFERSSDELASIGFEVERFGEQAILVRAVPTVVQKVDIRERMHAILGELADGGVGDSWLDSVAISAACHTSIRAGQALSLDEMRALVQQLERTRQPRACGHGRPTMLHMSQSDMERQFSRK